MAITAIAAPLLSEFHTSGEREKMQRMVTLAARGIFVFTGGIGLFIFILRVPLLSIFGEAFEAASTVLAILVFGQAINALTGPVGIIMVMTGHHDQVSRIVGFSAALNVVLNAALIPAWGIEGAAVATVITTAFKNLAMLVYVLRQQQINPTIFARGALAWK
jgi:O-antigen/teichoic acid export membrane protein